MNGEPEPRPPLDLPTEEEIAAKREQEEHALEQAAEHAASARAEELAGIEAEQLAEAEASAAEAAKPVPLADALAEEREEILAYLARHGVMLAPFEPVVSGIATSPDDEHRPISIISIHGLRSLKALLMENLPKDESLGTPGEF